MGREEMDTGEQDVRRKRVRWWDSTAEVPTNRRAAASSRQVSEDEADAGQLLQMERVLELKDGERRGWWASKRFDKRIRMRALVNGAVDDTRLKILLDTGANVSMISKKLAERLNLSKAMRRNKVITVQGINDKSGVAGGRVLVKITLGWNTVYVYDLWVMDHNAGVDVVLGTDFMIPAGVRLDMYNLKAKLPDEVVIPLVKSANAAEEPETGEEVLCVPSELLTIEPRGFKEYRAPKNQPGTSTHELWVKRTEKLVPTVISARSGRVKSVRLTNVADSRVCCPLRAEMAVWIPRGRMPQQEGYVRVHSPKYVDWQVIAYSAAKDKQLYHVEKEIYEQWLAKQPPVVPKPEYPWPKAILGRPTARAETVDALTKVQDPAEPICAIAFAMNSPVEASEFSAENEEEPVFTPVKEQWRVEDSLNELETAYFSAAATSGGEEPLDTEPGDTFTREGEPIMIEDYAHELAFLPEVDNSGQNELDFTAGNVVNSKLTAEQQARLVCCLERHKAILISSGNALPPPAYGVVCDIDVGDHAPIKQKSRRIPLKHMKKLYELLKGLLSAGLIAFSSSEWASPIVIVMKKNKVDIRLCIDYKMVNAVTKILEYAMPLVDDLLTELHSYLWFCSLDAASGFWAIVMSARARLISAFVCPLGHFEWLRMPFGLKNAPMIYQRMIDNALWGFVKPEEGWAERAQRVAQAETPAGNPADGSETVSAVVNDIFSEGAPEDSVLVPVFGRRSFVDDICFGAKTAEECLDILERLLARFEECRISVSFTKSLFCKNEVDFLSHKVSGNGLSADRKKLGQLKDLPFPSSKRGVQAFLGALNYYNRFIQDLAVYGAALYQLNDEDFRSEERLGPARAAFEMLKAKAAAAPVLKHFQPELDVHIMVFANNWALSGTVMQMHDGVLHPVRFCGRVLNDAETRYHPAEREVLALLRVLKVCYGQLAGRPITVYTRFSTLEWVYKSKNLFGRTVQFAVMLSPWSLTIKRVKEKDTKFVQLVHASITPFISLEESLAEFTPPKSSTAPVPIDPQLMYARLPRSYDGFVLTFDGSAKPEKSGGTGASSWIIWKLPEWEIEFAASAHLDAATVNEAEYIGMNRGVKECVSRGIQELVIVGDSRLAIQQAMGAIACHKDSLRIHLQEHNLLIAQLKRVRYRHVARSFNAAADSLATEALTTQTGWEIVSEQRKDGLKALNSAYKELYADEADEMTAEEHIEKPNGAERPAEEAAARPQQRDGPTEVDQPPEIVSAVTRSRSRISGNDEENHQYGESVEKAPPKPVAKAKGVTKSGSEPAEAADEYDGGRSDPLERPVEEQLNGSAPAESAETLQNALEERLKRIATAQDEEARWNLLKKYLQGNISELSYREAKDCSKLADRFVLDDKQLLHYLDKGRKWSVDEDPTPELKLVVPTTLIPEILQACHESYEGGHQGITRTYYRVRQEYYWVGLYRDVVDHVRGCADCSSSKGTPQLSGYSPGNILAERPFQLVSMDFVIPLPETSRGNTSLLLFQCSFTGYVIAKPMRDSGALAVAKAFEEKVFLQFGAPSMIRSDRDGRFIGEVFSHFRDMLGAQARATLSYRPQANGQQERSVQSVIKTVRIYAEDPLQRDWDDIAEKVVFAINTSMDATRKDTPFFLVHGWDPKNTIGAMLSLFKGRGDQSDAAKWRREICRQHGVALVLAKQYQATEKAKRAEVHNAQLTEAEIPAENGELDHSAFAEGRLVWLYMARVRPGLVKKLAHLWHGPFKILRRVDAFAFELELPNKSGYRFHPVVHISRLKLYRDYPERPTVLLVDGLAETGRLDFDEELLPEDSWERTRQDGEFEVGAILDDRLPLSTRSGRQHREFLVKWKGYEDPTWEPLSNLSCGGILYDYLLQRKRDNRLQVVQVADEE